MGVDEVFPNNPPEPVDGAVVEPPPKRLPPLVEGGLLVGVDENSPPGLASAPPLCPPPNREELPVAGVELFPPVEPNENVGVPLLDLLPKSPPEAGAVVDGLLWPVDDDVEVVLPKLNDMVSEVGDALMLDIKTRRGGKGAIAQEC